MVRPLHEDDTPTLSTPGIDPPIIDENGRILHISFVGNHQRSHFHAPWLWSNDPNNFYTASGQKKESPGMYDGSLIASAIVAKRFDLEEDGIILPTIPRRGGVHPLNLLPPVTGADDDDLQQQTDNDKEEDSLVLFITWQNGTETFYDLEWLRKWAYDSSSLKKGRQGREVTPRHTFVRKFLQQEELDSEIVRLRQYKGLRHVEYGDFVSNDKNGVYNALDVRKL